MSIIRWKPIDELEEVFSMFNKRLSSDLAIDMFEDEKTITLKMHIPGIDPDKINISMEDHYVHVSGSRKDEYETHDRNYYKKEIRRGDFERFIQLPPCAIDENQTTAECSNGVLTILFHKKNKTATGNRRILVTKK